MHLSISRPRLCALAALLGLVLGTVTDASAVGVVPRPEVTCAACIVVADTGEVLWSRAAATQRANASTTKMVTALLVAPATAPDEVVVVSGAAAATGGGGLDLSTGQRYTVSELLYALLLTSSNDAAVALAEHVGGSEAAFVERMNAYVEGKGLEDTSFVTPHGLDAAGHYSSAGDLARIARAVLRNPTLAVIVATSEITIDGPAGPALLENRNPLLDTYSGALGVKTGYTSQAGNVLVAAAERHGRRVFAVAMGSADAAQDAAALLDYGFARLARGVLVRAGTVVGEVVLDGAGTIPVVVGETLRGPQDPRSLTTTLVPEDRSDTGRLAAGVVVGSVVVTAGARTVATAEAVLGTSAPADEPHPIARALGKLLALAYVGAKMAGWV